ncbi:MAG: endopeptidase La [Ruminococcaceae bacterium]|nr:endopeptidase La [Oscillospiraceae bacterium]
MSEYTVKAETLSLPLIALEGTVAFPGEIVNLEITDKRYGSGEGAREAFEGSKYAIAVPITDNSENDPQLATVGTVIRVKQVLNTGDANIRCIAEGLSRAIVNDFRRTGKYYTANVLCKTITLPDRPSIKNQAYLRRLNEAAAALAKLLPPPAEKLLPTFKTLKNPAMLADVIASGLFIKFEDKLEILAAFEPYNRIEAVLAIAEDELEVLGIENELHKKTRERINRGQREYYLREEMKAIQEELGGDAMSEIDEYHNKIMALDASEEIKKKLLRENERLAKAPFGSAEATVIGNYLDVCLEIPWSAATKDRTDIKAAKKILDADHEGLEDVKDRLLEYLAVKQLNPDLKGQIICLYGPPGVGKTSIAASLARAMKRKYVRVSLGGIRDEADIRGHRKTYVGAMPGRIINAISQAGVKNPLILLDEIDKMANDGRGDPASAMLEVLDPEQNKFFRDHFVELPFDLSDCIFIATANTLDTVPRPLIDRMEIIELNTYTKSQKLSIAKNHLIPRQLKRHGLNRRMLKITDEALSDIIDCYTRESGVRNLERELGALCRKAAKRILEDGVKSVTVNQAVLRDILGPEKMIAEVISCEDEIGVVNGMAYTQSGGDLLKVECAVMDGTGKLELTGSLGDVMKESAHAAITYVRQIASRYGISADFYSKKDIHIHFPEGAVPKDGPSAGVTTLTALVSALSGIPVRRDVSMTGEITIRGKVLAIGGLREKTMAAYSAGVRTILIPFDNKKDLNKIDPVVKDNVTFVFCKSAEDVLCNALVHSEAIVHTDINHNNDKKEQALSIVSVAHTGTVAPTVSSKSGKQ